MRILKHILDFYINASIHVALSVYALTWITLIEFGVSYDESVLYFNFFGTITGYNFVKYFGLAKFHHRSLANWLKVIQLFSLICFAALCYYAIQLETKTWAFILVLGTITFFYAVPFLPRKVFVDSNQNLREISGLKIYVIALVWSAVTVLLPIVDNDLTITADVLITVLQRFVLVLVLMIPFEIRDLRYDSLKLSTIPQRIGLKNTKLIGVILLMVFFLSEFMKDETNQTLAILMGVVMFITLLFIIFSKENQGKYYSAFWVEGLPVLWLVLMLFYGAS
jgi:hypothetical protein